MFSLTVKYFGFEILYGNDLYRMHFLRNTTASCMSMPFFAHIFNKNTYLPLCTPYFKEMNAFTSACEVTLQSWKVSWDTAARKGLKNVWFKEVWRNFLPTHGR